MRCPYDIDCGYATQDTVGDGVFHLVITHKLTVVGAKRYEWEAKKE